ncbi:MAG: hypothetical protein ACXVHV_07790 [Methanobacterium sp.]
MLELKNVNKIGSEDEFASDPGNIREKQLISNITDKSTFINQTREFMQRGTCLEFI